MAAAAAAEITAASSKNLAEFCQYVDVVAADGGFWWHFPASWTRRTAAAAAAPIDASDRIKSSVTDEKEIQSGRRF